MTEFDCYKILGISPDADEQTIRKAFRALAKEKHPDTNADLTDSLEFIQLKKAMDILLDPTERMKHDRKFGYFEKPKNKGEHNKQEFSEYQKQKAAENVSQWERDSVLALRLRENERKAVIAAHQKRKRLVLIIVLVSLIPLSYLLYYIFMNYIFVLP